MRISANGGTPELLISNSQDGNTDFANSPAIVPGGDAVLSYDGNGNTGEIVVHSLVSGERKTLFAGTYPRYISTGHIVYGVGDVLFAVPFDVATLEVTGGPVALIEGIRGPPMQYAISDSGSLVYVPGVAGSTERAIALVDRNGEFEYLDVPAKEYLSPRLSPDGQTLLVQSVEESGNVLWTYDLDGDGAIQQLTFEGDNHRAVWTPDSQRITFSSDRDGTMSLYWMPADGSGVAERLTTAEEGAPHWMGSWSPDGQTLVFNVMRQLVTDWDIWTLSLEDLETRSLYDEPGTGYFGAELSPDGEWLAYSAGATSALLDVYVEPFPATGARRRISQTGGYWPLWSPEGNELIYRPISTTSGITLRSVDIVTEPNFAFTNEQTLPIERFNVVGYYRDYDLSANGEQLVLVFPADLDLTGQEASPRFNIVQNWFEEVKARVPMP
jgi:TolB protein